MRTGPRAAALLVLVAAAAAYPASPPRRAGTEPGHASGPARQPSDASAVPPGDRLLEFLTWAHPAAGGCAPPSDPRIVARWPDRLRVDFAILCGAERHELAAVLETREGKGVWQVAEGFETEPDLLETAIASGAVRVPEPPARGEEAEPSLEPPASRRASAPPSSPGPGIAPPPANQDESEGRPAIDGVVPPEALLEVHPEYPEEASRARLIGQARVELLVEVAPDGTPERTRPLRGPDPDLGLHRAAAEAVMRWRFRAATVAGRPVRYFAPVDLTFEGLPEESRSWVHRALFHVQAIVSSDPAPAEEAGRRLRAGEPLAQVVSALASGKAQGGDWGFVSATTLPAAVRKALHEIPVGETAGPIAADGLNYLVRKTGEIYYAILSAADEEISYRIVHKLEAPEGEALRRAVEADIADYLAERRRRAYVNEAARLMGIGQRQIEIGQLLIHTDALDDEEVKMLGRVIQAAIEAHRQFWEAIVPLRPFKQQVLVYAFARKSDHDRLHRIWQAGKVAAAGLPGPAGEYIPASRILAIPCEDMEGHLPIPIVVHEAIHMLDYETVYEAGVVPSKWFEEGLATYLGFSQIDSQLRIEPGEIRRSGTIVSGGVRMQFDPRAPLREYHRRIAEGEPVPLRLLLAAGPDDPLWTGDRSALGYGASWTLLHFLKEGGKGKRRPAFSDYARLEARGQGGPEAFERLFGPDLEALADSWHAYEADL